MGDISDRDREQYVKQLTRHCGDGRLTLDELEERVGEVWAATTPAELQHAMRELPRLRPDRGAVGVPAGGHAAAMARPAGPVPPAAARRTRHVSAARGGLVCAGRPPAILLTIAIVMLLTAHWIAAAVLLAIAAPKLNRAYRVS